MHWMTSVFRSITSGGRRLPLADLPGCKATFTTSSCLPIYIRRVFTGAPLTAPMAEEIEDEGTETKDTGTTTKGFDFADVC